MHSTSGVPVDEKKKKLSPGGCVIYVNSVYISGGVRVQHIVPSVRFREGIGGMYDPTGDNIT